jgi:hypothetical protein
MNGVVSFTRRLRTPTSRAEYICSRCAKFSNSNAVQSGHNRWSKIKHDKGAADMKKNAQRSQFSKDIYLASKRKNLSRMCEVHMLTYSTVGGGDVNGNPRLATLVAAARKGMHNSFPSRYITPILTSHSWLSETIDRSSNCTRARKVHNRRSARKLHDGMHNATPNSHDTRSRDR